MSLFLIILYSCIGIIALVTFGFSLWYILEKMWLLRAGRIEAEKQAHTKVVVNDGQIFIRETNPKAIWRTAHLDARIIVNGKKEYEPSQIEVETWNRFNKPSQKPLELPSKASQITSKTFYEILDTYPHLMLIGGTGSGKTTQMNNAIEYLVKSNPYARVCWLSTHAGLDAGQIYSKAVIIQKPDEIIQALEDLFRTYESRRDNPRKHSKLIVALDEWPELIDEYKDAGQFLRRMSRGARKTNITLLLASHGSNVGDLGIKGHSSVKDDFAEVYLDAKDMTKAMWNKEEISLQPVIELESIEKKVMRLYNLGWSKRKISKEVWDGIGSYYNKKIERILNNE